MSFLDKLRKKAEELDLETKARQLQEAATHAAQQAREKAGEFTAEHREQIDGYVETAGAKIDEKTDHRYADQIAKVTQQLEHGVDLVADGYGPAAGTATATGAAAAAGAATGAGDEPFPTDPDAPGPVSAGPLEPPAPVEEPSPVHASDLSAAEAQEPVSRQDPSWEAAGVPADAPTDALIDQPAGHHGVDQAEQAGEPVDESLVDSALEDTVLGLDHPPVTPAHHDEPTPEDADPSTTRSPRPPHGSTS
ncbi:Rv0909 family putative TA system antitoxin [Terrabacter sp. BE26]|uniref:antitoxin n=1 Tax=Terrabacter sp. BE26 TaxID=2898152 RepID=UPI0035BE1BA4